MKESTSTNILLLLSIMVCICVLCFTKSGEMQSSNTAVGTFKTLVIEEYKLKNKKINKSDIDDFLGMYETVPLLELVYITKELPDNFTFESPFFDERDYSLFKRVLEPIGYKININHRIESGGFYKREQSYYVIEISRWF